jgi:hypothetical protein
MEMEPVILAVVLILVALTISRKQTDVRKLALKNVSGIVKLERMNTESFRELSSRPVQRMQHSKSQATEF